MSKLKSHIISISFCLILFTAVFLRLGGLGRLPPGGENALFLRLPTAICGIASIGLMILIVRKLSERYDVALISGFVLALMPWHIVQSRIYSPPLIGLTVILGGIWFYLNVTHKALKLGGIVITLLLFRMFYSDLWLFHEIRFAPTIPQFLNNLFKLMSVEFLFFRNDSFWWGDLRTWGTQLPSLIPLLGLGLIATIRTVKLSQILLTCFYFVCVWFVAAADPAFPETREFFLAAPLFAVISAIGVIKLYDYFIGKSTLVKAVICLYIAFIAYEHLIFFHFYTVHYVLRVGNEIHYAKMAF